MRNFLFILMLIPGMALAGTYKCVVDGKTTYSQEPCGANAEKMQPGKLLSGVGAAKPVPAPGTGMKPAADTRSAASAPVAAQPPSGTPSVTEREESCAARLQAYQASMACFAPYRINANVMDPEAFKHCETVPEPTDCMAGGTQ